MPVATSSQAHVIDLLVQKFQGLALTATNPVTGLTEPVPVYDGTEGPSDAAMFVLVMGWPGDETAAQLNWLWLGTAAREEHYDLMIGVFSYVGGDNAYADFGNDDAQKTARANANTIHAALEAALLADRNLATQNGGTQACVWALMTECAYTEEPPDGGEMGRYARFRCKVGVYNLLT